MRSPRGVDEELLKLDKPLLTTAAGAKMTLLICRRFSVQITIPSFVVFASSRGGFCNWPLLTEDRLDRIGGAGTQNWHTVYAIFGL